MGHLRSVTCGMKDKAVGFDTGARKMPLRWRIRLAWRILFAVPTTAPIPDYTLKFRGKPVNQIMF